MAKLAAYTALLGALIWMVFAFAEKGDPEDFGLQADVNVATEPPAKAHASIIGVLVQHCEAIPFSNAESLSISGSYFSIGVKWDMTLLSKWPGLSRQSLDYGNYTIVAGYDGSEYWELSSSSSEEESDPYAVLNEKLLILECGLYSLAWEYVRNDNRSLSLAGEGQVDGEPCFLVANGSLLTGEKVIHYISADSGLELQRTASISENSLRADVRIEYSYREGEHSAGVGRIAGYKLFLDNELKATTEFESIMPNRGVASWLFQHPPGVNPTIR